MSKRFFVTHTYVVADDVTFGEFLNATLLAPSPPQRVVVREPQRRVARWVATGVKDER